MSLLLVSILTKFQLQELAVTFDAHGIDDDVLSQLTDENLRELGVHQIGLRKKLLAAFSDENLPHSQPVDRTPPVIVELSSSASVPPPVPMDAASIPAPQQATCTSPFLNSLGQRFVPIKPDVLICIWPTRVRDFQAFCDATRVTCPDCDFDQTPDDPVVNVSWIDAFEFCRWLTAHESKLGTLPAGHFYDLPSDLDWSSAVGLVNEYGATPEERSGKAKGYPWGAEFPPPPGAGNYHPTLQVEDYAETSPVGSFRANELGIHDLGGNVWEWCLDKYEPDSDHHVLRGASCFNDDPEFLLSSYRDRNSPGRRRNNNGFRVLLKKKPASNPWF